MRAATPIRTTVFALVGLAASASLGIAGEQSGPARDRLAPTISPQGCDSPAVAAAIGRAAPGDTVHLAAGTYELQEAIRPKSKLRLIGAGQEKSTLVYRGTKPSVLISLADCDDVELAHMTLDGQALPGRRPGRRVSLPGHHPCRATGVVPVCFASHGEPDQ